MLALSECSNNREKWLELKSRTIGSSEIATICGLNSYRTPLELWAEKTGKITPFEGNDATLLGQLMEPVIATLFNKKSGLEVERADDMWISDVMPWASATPDYYVTEEDMTGILECKNTNYRSADDWEESAPFWAQIQLQWQLGVVQISFGYIGCLIGANASDLKRPRIEFSKEIFDQALDAAHQFMKFITSDIPPSAGPGDKDVLELLIKERQDKAIVLPTETSALISEYLRIKADRLAGEKVTKELKKLEDGYSNRLLQYLGSATEGVIDNYRIKATTVIKEPYMNKGSKYTLFTAKQIEV